jgi:hypothetical protein
MVKKPRFVASITDWFRRKARGWLLGHEEPDPYLDCVVSNRAGGRDVRRYWIVGSVGIRLNGVPAEGGKSRGEIRSIGERQFWSLWRRFNPDAELTWEDGEKFFPDS